MLCLMLPACSDYLQEMMMLDSSIRVSLGISTRAVEQEGKEVGNGLPQSLKVWIYGVKDNEETLLAYISQVASEGSAIFNDGTDLYGNPVEVIERELEKGKEYEKLNFYVVLNDGAVTWSQGTTLDENTTSTVLRSMTFNFPTPITYTNDNEQLMYGESTLDIIASKTNYDVEIPAERTVAKLELFFTKRDIDKVLVINSVKMESDVNKGYLLEQQELNDIYADSNVETTLFTNLENSGSIDCASTEEYGNFSKDEKNFKLLVSSFLLENPIGLDWKEETEVYPGSEDEIAHAYKVMLNYTYDGVTKDVSFYLPKVERNVLTKIYVRIRDLSWEVDVFPYTGVVLEPEFGL